jgi:hypothetical protein
MWIPDDTARCQLGPPDFGSMKTAYVPTAHLPLVNNLMSNWDVFEAECTALLNAHPRNSKPRMELGGRNRTSDPLQSYVGQVQAVAIKVDPVVLDDVEYKKVYGTTDAQYQFKRKLIARRLAMLPFLRQWLMSNYAAVLHAGLFIVYPGAKINPHYGVHPSYVRIHICIEPNELALFHTEFDEPRTWAKKDVFGFLDYDVKHWVTFDAPDDSPRRVIFYIDVHGDYYNRFYPGTMEVQRALNK